MEWIVVWLLVLASVRVFKSAAVDAWVQITDPRREAPSLAERRVRAELAQQQAMTTGAPGVGQAFADRLACRIANPPVRPPWVTEALNYLGLLLADAFANARRRHVAKQRDREQRGDQSRTGKPGSPYCWRCDVNHVDREGDLCATCTPVVLRQCPGCEVLVPVAELDEHDRCETCRRPGRGHPTTPDDGEQPGPARLVIRS